MAVLHSPMDAVSIGARHDPHTVCVAHHHAAATARHVSTHGVASVLTNDAAVKNFEWADLHLAALIHEIDLVLS